MDQLRHDVRFAFRSILRNPTISLAVTISLALGIGANAAIFSVVDALVLRPLPYPESHQLVELTETFPERGWTGVNTSMPKIVDWRQQSRTMEIAGYDNVGLNMSGSDQPERLSGLAVTYNFFDVLRVRPALGRGFLPEEEGEGSGRVIVVSTGLWQRSFGADPEILGRAVSLDGEQHTVVGVMGPDFRFGSPLHEIWIPLEEPEEEWRATHYMNAVGRIRSGSSIELARSEISQIQARMGNAYPEVFGWDAAVVPLQDGLVNEGIRQGSAVVSVAVFLVLLVACANVTNLLLARGAGRQREISLRGALGAGRGRIARQLLTESVILAFAGGTLGLLIAVVGIRGIASLIPPSIPRVGEIQLDPRALAFTGTLTLLSGLVFGLLPTLHASRPNLREALGEGGRGGSGSRGGKLRDALVMGEISLAMVLLISATLLVKSFAGMRSVELGFGTDDVVTATVTLPEVKYPEDADMISFHRDLLRRIRGIPGVVEAGGSSGLPMWSIDRTQYSIPGRPAPDESQAPFVYFRSLTPGYLEAMSMTLVAGRTIDDGDRRGTPKVALVNKRLAEREWPGESPLGETLAFGETVHEIVGVVANTRDFGPGGLPPVMAYTPAYQIGDRRMSYAVQTSSEPSSLIEEIRARVQAADPDQPIYSVTTMAAVVEEAISRDAAMTKVVGALAVIAFVLAAAGVYGVLGYSVARRTQEMGIRMALGAQRGRILWLVVRQGSTMALVGIAAGLLVAFAATRGLAFFLVGVDPLDLQIFGLVTLAVLLTGVASSYLPARQATRVDPMLALRQD